MRGASSGAEEQNPSRETNRHGKRRVGNVQRACMCVCVSQHRDPNYKPSPADIRQALKRLLSPTEQVRVGMDCYMQP